WLSGCRSCKQVWLQATLMPFSECFHELAEHFRGIPVFSQAGPLERLSEFSFNTNTEANVFARHSVTVSHGYTLVYPKRLSCLCCTCPASFDTSPPSRGR